ncbi:hypothetical protein H0H87_011975, partial [Tephrocybe sp. NHM501043]
PAPLKLKTDVKEYPIVNLASGSNQLPVDIALGAFDLTDPTSTLNLCRFVLGLSDFFDSLGDQFKNFHLPLHLRPLAWRADEKDLYLPSYGEVSGPSFISRWEDTCSRVAETFDVNDTQDELVEFVGNDHRGKGTSNDVDYSRRDVEEDVSDSPKNNPEEVVGVDHNEGYVIEDTRNAPLPDEGKQGFDKASQGSSCKDDQGFEEDDQISDDDNYDYFEDAENCGRDNRGFESGDYTSAAKVDWSIDDASNNPEDISAESSFEYAKPLRFSMHRSLF